MTHPPAPWRFWDQPSKAEKWAEAQFLEIPTPSPKQLEKSSHPLAYEITQLIKANPIFWASRFLRWPTLSVECISPKATLAPWDRPHSLYGMCISLNKTTSYPSLCFSLNSFCNETSGTWALLGTETRCVVSIKRLWVQVPSDLHGFSFITMWMYLVLQNSTFKNGKMLRENAYMYDSVPLLST